MKKSSCQVDSRIIRKSKKTLYQTSAIEQGFSPVSGWDTSKRPPLPSDIKAITARQQIENGFTVSSQDGKTISFTQEILKHWESEEGYDEKQVNGRLKRLEMARETVRTPAEIWDQGKQTAYVQLFRKKTGGLLGCVVFVHKTNVVKTYFPKEARTMEKVRKGIKLK